MNDFIPYQLPDISYDFSALEPVISGEIMELHYKKHHQAYVTNLNLALEKACEAKNRGDLTLMISLQQAIRFNGGGHLNHSIFWTNLAPLGKGGGEGPQGELAQSIQKEFGSTEKLIEELNGLALGIQGSGWGWLGYHPVHKRLIVSSCANQDPLGATGLVPLLGIDVWEHAYYLQYKNVRAEYLKNIWKVVNWKNVEERFLLAKK